MWRRRKPPRARWAIAITAALLLHAPVVAALLATARPGSSLALAPPVPSDDGADGEGEAAADRTDDRPLEVSVLVDELERKERASPMDEAKKPRREEERASG